MAPRTLVVSAGHMLIRGHQAIATDRTTPNGEPINAVYGVARALMRALKHKMPDRAVAVHGPVPSNLNDQAQQLHALLNTLDIHRVDTEDEAECTAAYARAAAIQGDDVIIVGSDKRYAQLVDQRVWWHDAYKDARYTPEMVVKRFMVPPHQVADWLALVGDTDALAGIKGIGKKSATALLTSYGTVESALKNIDILDTRTKNALRAAQDLIDRELAKARLDAPTARLDLSPLAYTPVDSKQLDAHFRTLGFFELLRANSDSLSVTLCRNEAQARAAIEAWPKMAPVSLFAVFAASSPLRGRLLGLATHVAGQNVYFETEAAIASVAGWLADSRQPKLGHDVSALIAGLTKNEIPIAGFVADTACASHLLEPSNHAPHDLPLLARLILQRPLTPDDRIDLRSVSAEAIARFAAERAKAIHDIWQNLAPRIAPERMTEYLELSKTTARMAVKGMAVDREVLAQLDRDFTADAHALEEQVYTHAKRRFNLGSVKQLGAVLFEDLSLTVYKRTKTGWSTATEALERIQHEHPIVALVIEWRALKRLHSTWVTALSEHIEQDGRVRSTFHVARSFSGRIINSVPDLGRVPGRTSQMQHIRRAFVAAPGTSLLSVDYRQLGLHVLAHLSGDPALIEPLRREDDMHRLTASVVLDISIDSVTTEQRQLGKLVNFATFAGQGSSALAQQLDISAQEAKRIIARFDQRFQRVRDFQETQLRLARERGYIVTIAGRQWPIGDLESLDPQERSYAERLARRATHEASVADVSRRGLLHAEHALRAAGLSTVPLLQIHDEVLFEVPVSEMDQSAQIASEAMASAFTLEVPLKVGMKAGPNWAELRPL